MFTGATMPWRAVKTVMKGSTSVGSNCTPAPQLGDDVLGRQAALIRLVERHRGDGIGDLHDPGQQRGLRAGHAVGVAAAIVALVMVRHDVQHRGVVDEAADDGDAVDHAA